MALKDLLVYVDQTDDALERLRLAADLAIRHDSHLAALYAREWSRAQLDWRKAAELGLISARGLSTLDHEIAAEISSAADRIGAMLTELNRVRGLRAELLGFDGAAPNVLPQYARYTDLCILGQEGPDGPASVNYTFSEQLLFVTGRPVLFVPAGKAFVSLGRHIAVAWNSSRPAARSLNDAMPLIERAERATVIMINPSGFIDTHEGPAGEPMVEHLRRHGATVEAVRIEELPHGDIAARLQQEALTRGADLLVAGAFGHPRLWEKMLGSVTHELIAKTNLPILMSY
jgi:nucleotide-binding universal stress UspA family protein